MALARERLRATDDGLAAVARAVGNRSEFSFAAAFKRHHGLSPRRWRAHSCAGPVPAG
jgi:AraC-like DNA-binding protein